MSYKEGAGGGVSHTPAGLRVRGTGQGTGRMTTGRRLNRTTETKAPTKNHNQIRNAQAMIIGGGRVGGVGAIVCGCCSSGRVYGGCGWTCGRESRVVGRRASQSVCSVQCCRCVGRRVVLGVVSCWASCSRVVLQQGGGSCGSLRAGSAASRVGEGSDRRQRALHGKSLGIKHR